MNIIEKDSKFLVEREDGRFCSFNKPKAAEYMIHIVKMIENNKISELNIVNIDEVTFDIQFNMDYLLLVRQWCLKYGTINDDFDEDSFFNVTFTLNNRVIKMAPYASAFIIGYKDDLDYKKGREMIFKIPKNEDDFRRIFRYI